jgi:stress response protein YsnF
MSRIVIALYDSRGEADDARRRLVSDIKTRSTRIVGQDTSAAIDSLQVDAKDMQTYRDALRDGSYLLVAEIEAGQDPKRVIKALEQSIGAADAEPPAQEPAPSSATAFEEPSVPMRSRKRVARAAIEEPSVAAASADQRATPEQVEAPLVQGVDEQVVQQERVPLVQEELRIGTRQVSRGGARVRSVIREAPAEEQVNLSEEHVDIQNRPAERRLSLEDVESGGLLKERIFEIREMREEPVITKEAFVREEVIVRKTVQERTETIRDTVRRTEVEVEEMPAREPPRRGFLGGRPGRK